MDVKSYLERINFKGKANLDFKTLAELQKAHLFNVPFENLDIHYGKRIISVKENIFRKIIFEKRGGFCYELNGLFYYLLRELGFEVKIISGRVFSQKKDYGKEFDHLALIVKVDKTEYLVDVGFGEFVMKPLKFELGKELMDERGVFIFDKYNEEYFRINKKENSKFIPQYIFKTQARNLSDFEEMCNYHQFDFESHFTKKKVITIPNKDGRITLNNSQLKITKGKTIQEIKFNELEVFDRYLWDYFKIEMKNVSC